MLTPNHFWVRRLCRRYGRIALMVAVANLIVRGQQTDKASEIYAQSSKSVLILLVKSESGQTVAQGSGFIVAGGKIITNEHVARAGRVFVDLGAAKLPTTVEKSDQFNDLAILSTDAELSTAPLTLARDLPAPGSAVYVIGNPEGLDRSISTGIVSAVRLLQGRQLIQITAPISPGSSGGPVLNVRGQVIGVAVGMLEEGQNLNFAVPSIVLEKLINSDGAGATLDVPSLLGMAAGLVEKRKVAQYSTDADSEWQVLDRQVDSTLQKALERAGSDAKLLLSVADAAGGQNVDIAIAAAEKSVHSKPTAEANLRLGIALKAKSWFSNDTEKATLRERSEKAIRTAMKMVSVPTATMYFHLGDVLEDRGSYLEAESAFRRAADLSKGSDDSVYADCLRGLTRTAFSLSKPAEGKKWFNALVQTGNANAWDWQAQAGKLAGTSDYQGAGESYMRAASMGALWTNWCDAATSFVSASASEDNALFCARKCLEVGVGKKDSDTNLEAAHYVIAITLNSRGVYQEALSHAREAIAINSSSAWNYDAQATALLGLRRFQEAVTASTQAIRLSDGKWPSMHFHLGNAYFELENWEFARQSFEKAAQMDQKDDAAAYNVALCYVNLKYYNDAANWYEEVLRRNPNHPQKQEIVRRIDILRK
jgi:tetratricopeptide (TPR) repeat protein